nr:MAG TPA: hypothetical protein [Caudoviricetes sp.]
MTNFNKCGSASLNECGKGIIFLLELIQPKNTNFNISHT